MRGRLLELFFESPTAMAIAAVFAVIIGAVWYYNETKESKDADAARRDERAKDPSRDPFWDK